MRHVISKQVDHTVTLGQSGYGDALTITQSGIIAPLYVALPQAGADGIDIAASVARAHILNQGSVIAAAGAMATAARDATTGGVGIDFSSAGRLDNQGTVTGGAGGIAKYTVQYTAAAGGAGIILATGAMLANAGSVTGGAGGDLYSDYFSYKGGDGGVGVHLAAGAALANTGIVSGGAGGYAYIGGVGNGGAGILADGSDRLSNSGTIAGGPGGDHGGIQPDFTGTGIDGLGGTGVLLGDGGRLTNGGLIVGGRGGGSAPRGISDNGGTGVELGGAATLVNSGTVAGGTGGDANFYNYFVPAAAGGAGVVIDASGVAINTGHITGGNAGYVLSSYGKPGGVGVDVGVGTLNNMGSIAGGIGSYGYPGGNYGPSYNAEGGAGVTLAGGRVVNAGTITGGAGYRGNYSSGGVGLSLTSGTVVNTGTIAGGAGPKAYPGIVGAFSGGGYGVVLSGGALSNAGTIVGGQGGVAYTASEIGRSGGAGVSISGGVLTNTGLIQGGQGGAGLPLGKPKNGIAIGGNGGAGVVVNGGTLVTAGTIAGGLGGASMASPGAMGDAVQFGTLAGTLVIDPGAMFSGLVVADAAASDTLVLAASFTSGTISGIGSEYTGFSNIDEAAGAHWILAGKNTLASSATLSFAGSLTVVGTLLGGVATFASGDHETLAIGPHASVATTLSGFAAGDTIDIAKIATSLTFSGGTLTLFNGASGVETLSLAGSYTQADFHLAADGHGGTNVTVNGAEVAAQLFNVSLPALAQQAHDPGTALGGGLSPHQAGQETSLLVAGMFAHHML